LQEARALAEQSIRRFQNQKNLLGVYCDLGIEIYRRTGDRSAYAAALAALRAAEERMADPDLADLIARYGDRIPESTTLVEPPHEH
jgi:hypothetical protein